MNERTISSILTIVFHFRKVIIFFSDAEQHYALDGLLGGIIDNFDTNDCKTKDGKLQPTDSSFKKLYTEEQSFDYPSFGQVITFLSYLLLVFRLVE